MDGEGNDDVLKGGGGGDFLFASDGMDTFVYKKLSDSLPDAGKFDNIGPFDQGDGDQIDLHAIDADTTEDGDQAFFLGGSSFSHQAGELIQFAAGPHTRLEGDVDGDGDADIAIEFTYFGSPLVLTNGDFDF